MNQKTFGVALVASIIGLVTALFLSPAIQWQASAQSPTLAGPGRYVIFSNPNVRADTFLVDTQTGKVWYPVTITDAEGRPTVWKYMERVDSAEQWIQWLERQRFVNEESK